MSIADAINGGFEFLSGFMLWRNVAILLRQKQVRGVSVLTTAMFATWGYWNLYYYPSLNQWLSFFGGLNVVASNTTWVVLAVIYSRRSKEDK
jgi:hypothetical protein